MRTNVYKNLSLEKLIALEKGDRRLQKGEHWQRHREGWRRRQRTRIRPHKADIWCTGRACSEDNAHPAGNRAPTTKRINHVQLDWAPDRSRRSALCRSRRVSYVTPLSEARLTAARRVNELLVWLVRSRRNRSSAAPGEDPFDDSIYWDCARSTDTGHT